MPNCRFCNTPLGEPFLDLGHQPPSNALLTEDQLDEPEVYYPLKAYFCGNCYLVQIPEYIEPAGVFNESYPYYSSQSPSNVSHAKEFSEKMLKRFIPKRVLEIGSNDGYMLQFFKEAGCNVLGVEPSKGPADYAISEGIPTLITFFPPAEHIGGWDLICGINTFAHQPDLHNFVKGLNFYLAPQGVIVQEFPHLLKTMRGTQYDQFYHEHYNYFSLIFLRKLFEKYGLEIFDVEGIPEHGGSIRVYVAHKGTFPITPIVAKLTLDEMLYGLTERSTYTNFGYHVSELRLSMLDTLSGLSDQLIFAYGAAAKGNTLLNSIPHITERLVVDAIDRSPYKQGKYLPGIHLRIHEEAHIREWKPRYILILPWNLKDEIMNQLSYIREWGGRFIIPIPKVEIL